jgi:aspartyl-tRNA(Asn)/glutamyl-tRNA(Gln) amidotransferase subunit B
MEPYEPVIGLEVHAQIHTASKMFCSCPVAQDTGDLAPNAYVCPVCTGMPGTLPTINRRAVEMCILTGLALDCDIPPVARFARKSYTYPDLPKGYQISQHSLPLGRNGCLEIKTECGIRQIGINNVHLEEDTGKLYHREDATLVDLNRSGVPLIEIVTEPELRSAEEVHQFATKLRLILIYLGINSGDMEKGVMRFEASISIRPAGSDELNPRHEIKNLNSFRALVRAAEYDIAEQMEIVARGERVIQQTLGWDESRGETYSQRLKEVAADYRYFPEPDLPPLEVDRDWMEDLRAQLPELPAARQERLVTEYGLRRSEAEALVADKPVVDFYERAVSLGGPDPRPIAHWILGDLFRLFNETGQTLAEIPISPQALVNLIALVESDIINRNTGWEVLLEMAASGRPADDIVEERGWALISDGPALSQAIEVVLDENPSQVEEYLAGKSQVAAWLMGQVMRATEGRADPQRVKRLLREALERRLV